MKLQINQGLSLALLLILVAPGFILTAAPSDRHIVFQSRVYGFGPIVGNEVQLSIRSMSQSEESMNSETRITTTSESIDKVRKRAHLADLTPYPGRLHIILSSDWDDWPGIGTEEDPKRIENLYIDTDAQAVLISPTTHHFIISNCTIISSGTEYDIGIELYGSKNGVIQNCTIIADIGIWMYGSSTEQSRNNIIFNNTITSTDRFYLFTDSRVTGSHAIILGADFTGHAPSIYNTIINNTCVSDSATVNIKGEANAIKLWRANNNTVANNTCLSPSYNGIGICLEEAYHNIISTNNCTLTGLAEEGIQLIDSDYNTIDENTCTKVVPAINGIYLETSEFNTISGNQIDGFDINSEYAIRLYQSNSNTVIENICTQSYGIYLHYSNTSLVSRNSCSGSVFGIRLYGTENNTVQQNTCFSTDYGISVRLSYWTHIRDNECFSNTYHGIHTRDSVLTRIYLNLCYLNENGIALVAGDTEAVYQNNCSSNDYGINLSNTDNSHIYNNDCIKNVIVGVYLYQSENNEVFDNICNDNNQGIALVGTSASVTSESNIVNDNVCVGNTYGIYLNFAQYNNMTGNVCSNIHTGIYVDQYTTQNKVAYNYCNSSSWGILTQGVANVIIQNIVGGHAYGILCGATSISNVVNWNTMGTSTTRCAYDSGTSNSWDYNYYNDYAGADANNDSIGDTAHPIFNGVPALTNWDIHPLMYSPTPAVWVTPPTDLSLEYYYEDLSLAVEATAPTIINYYINDTVNFDMHWTGLITNNTALSIGTYYLDVGVENVYGFWLNTTIRIDCVDTTDPTWDEMPSSQFIELGNSLSYNVNASDIQGVDSWWVSDTTNFSISGLGVVTNNSLLILDVYTLEVRAYDASGNYCNATILVTLEDTSDPYWDEIPLDGIIELGDSFSYNVNASDLDVIDYYWLSDEVNFTVSASGLISNVASLILDNYTIEVRAYDRSGNYCNVTIIVTVEDTISPTWDVLPTDQISEVGSSFTYDVDASDLDGINNWWISDDANFSISASGLITNDVQLLVGVYSIEVRGYDRSGHYCTATFMVTAEDTSAPTWDEVPTDQVVEFGTSFAYKVNASDFGGLQYYWLNDTTYFEIGLDGLIENIGFLPIGTYTLIVRAYDIFDLFCSSTITITVQDSISPAWTQEPSNQSAEYGDAVSLQVSASDSNGIDHYWISDTMLFSIDESGYIENIGLIPVGVHSLEIRGYDPYDNYCTVTITVSVEDTTPPEWVDEPTNQILAYGEILSYQLQVTDLSSLGAWSLNDTVHFSISDGLISNVSELAEGQYGLTVIIEDVHGNSVTDIFYVYVLPSNMFATTPSSHTTPSQPTDLGPVIMVLMGVAGGVAIVFVFMLFLKRKQV